MNPSEWARIAGIVELIIWNLMGLLCFMVPIQCRILRQH
jgi:hypothetical protein